MQIVTHEFDPCYTKDSKILILGSIPSVKSREVGFYYGHPKNRFWNVLSTVLGEKEPETIEEKKTLLKKHQIALWDVVATCMIEGSSDTSIKNPVCNPIDDLVKKTSIFSIFTTGKKAYELYQKYVYPKTKIEAIYLPSTSPANCACSIDQLVKHYSLIKEILQKTVD